MRTKRSCKVHEHIGSSNTQGDLVHRMLSINYKDQSDPGFITHTIL